MTALLPSEALAACAAEPIHVPGAIQPHGVLLVVDEATRKVLQASANLADLLGLPRANGCPLADVIGPGAAQAVEEALAELGPERPLLAGRVEVGDGRLCDLLVHRPSAGRLIVELEADPAGEANATRPIHDFVRSFLRRLRETEALPAMCELAARELRRVCGFDHALVYAFDADGHGEVLAEARAPGWTASYLGHHFPASDIPAQARALYLRNPIRLIADAAYVPVPLEPALDPERGQPTDLTFAALRSVSPVHLEYMRNMGTRASMSASIVVGGRLWGLVSCHHAEPRRVPYVVRSAVEHLAQVLALKIESHEEKREIDHRLELRALLVTMLEELGRSGEGSLLPLATLHDGERLLRFAAASGAAVIEKGRIASAGQVPGEDELRALADWLAARGQAVYATDALAEAHPPAAAYAGLASGLLAVAVSKRHRDFVLWFRPETPRTLKWAGDPNKPLADDGRLHPRRSFATWVEERRGRAPPWRPSERDLAVEFRDAMLGIVLERAEAVAQLAGELARSNAELEAFSYSVSHDLRAPLRHIAGYADLIDGGRADEPSRLSERERRYIGNIKDAAAFAGSLVDALLSFSRIGRVGLERVDVPLDALVAGVVHTTRLAPEGRSATWRIGPLPVVRGDALLLRLAVENLIGNAVKYSAMRTPAVIEVRAVEDREAGLHGFAVTDNGVGFDMKYAHKLFGVFQRLHGMDDFEGTGIGLANVRRIAERHGGTVQAAGEVGRGATFTFLLPC